MSDVRACRLSRPARRCPSRPARVDRPDDALPPTRHVSAPNRTAVPDDERQIVSLPRALLLDPTMAGSWQEDAACKGIDIEMFFSLDDEDQARALDLCRACDVQQDCLRTAIEQREMYGIWGGTREAERRSIIREHRRAERERRRVIDAA